MRPLLPRLARWLLRQAETSARMDGAFIRWEPIRDQRDRHPDWSRAIKGPIEWDQRPPRHLGRFNCRGEFVPDLLPWIRPEIRRLEAGSAEGGRGSIPDAGGTPGGS